MAGEVPAVKEGAMEAWKDLRHTSLKALMVFTACVTQLWVYYLLLPVSPFPEAWYGLGLLALGTVGSYLLAKRNGHAAAFALILSILGANGLALSYFGAGPASYAPALVVILSGLLLSPISSCAIALASAWMVYALTPPSQAIPAIAIILLSAAASWLSQHNLYTALEWAWNSQAEAWRKTELARDRQSELQHTARALDDANYRIRRMNQRLLWATERAEDARRLKQQFAANISHELRTPLNLIVGFSRTMFLSPESYGGVQLPSAYRGDVHAIYRNGQHLLHLIDDVLDLAQIEAGRMVLMKEMVDLRGAIFETAETVDGLLQKKGLTLEVDVPGDIPPVYADAMRLQQVLLNLLNNSYRFTESGGITVRARVVEHEVIVSVDDTGTGIPEDTMAHIFEEFYPLEGPTTRHEGRGLGLPICKQLVELHGGRMWVESEMGEGSTFHFSLPLLKTHSDGARERTHSTEYITPFPVPADRSFLMLDIDHTVGQVLERHVEGYQALEAHNGQDALRLIREYRPRAIVAGVDPHASGTKWAALGDALDGLPLIVCPALERPWASLALSAADYLVKPITSERLFNALDDVDASAERVLVVEDSRDMVRLLERMLRSRGQRYVVSKAYSGEQALALLAYQRPDVVLLDLMTPGMDGVDVLRRMQEDPSLANVPVIIVTAREYLHESLPAEDLVQVKVRGGFSTGELVKCLEAILDSLEPRLTSPANVREQPATSPRQ